MLMSRESERASDGTRILPRPIGGMRIRDAEEADIPWLLRELKAFSDFNDTRAKLFDPVDSKTSAAFLRNLIENHVLLVAVTHHGESAGFIGGLVTTHLFNPKINVLFELFWWVSHGYRASRAGALLLHAFMERAREMKETRNIHWVTMALETKSPVNADALLKRGFRHLETNYIMEI